MGLSSPLQVYGQSFSCKNAYIMPVDLDFTSSNEFQLDLTPYVDQGYIDFVNTVYYDLKAASYEIQLGSNICSQVVYCEAGTVGYQPIFLGQRPVINAKVSTAINAVVQIFVSNIPYFPAIQRFS